MAVTKTVSGVWVSLQGTLGEVRAQLNADNVGMVKVKGFVQNSDGSVFTVLYHT